MAAFETALLRLQNDTTLSRNNRMDALYARIQLARIDLPKDTVQPQLPDALVKDVREFVSRADREITDGYERQAVITYAGSALGLAGLWAESEALLKANLAKSHSPYYLMSQLGSNARKQGKKEEALNWYGQAFDKSEGPATRLQWGASYLMALVDLAPQDARRIEKTTAQLITEAAKDNGAFEGRSVRSLQRVSSKLVAWNADGKQAATLKRLQSAAERRLRQGGHRRRPARRLPGAAEACRQEGGLSARALPVGRAARPGLPDARPLTHACSTFRAVQGS